MKIPHFNDDGYEEDEPFQKKFSWDPDKPKGWEYREGTNRNGKQYRGYFPPPSAKNASPIWLKAYPPYGMPRHTQSRGWSRGYGSGDPSTGDALSAMFWGAPNM